MNRSTLAADDGAPLRLTGHLPALDGLRGVAILAVMLFHQTLLTGGGAVDRGVAFWMNAGWAGVDLFFVLSGFLITGILYDAKGSESYFRNFYARRMLRIFPLYYAVLVLCFVVLPRLDHPMAAAWGAVQDDQGWYWLYLSNLLIASEGIFRHSILDISWSLAIEEQFYLAWPLVVFYCGRRRLMQICGALVAVAIAWRTGALLAEVEPLSVYVFTLSRVDALAVGSLLALAVRDGASHGALIRYARPAAIAAGVLLLSVAFAQGGFDPFGPVMQVVGYTLLALLFGSVLLLSLAAREGSWSWRLLRSPFLRTFGKYSYALYLFHLPLRAVIRDTFYGADQFLTVGGSRVPGQILFYVMATALALAAAWASWHLYEKHFLQLKRFFVSRPRSSAGRVGEAALQRITAP